MRCGMNMHTSHYARRWMRWYHEINLWRGRPSISVASMLRSWDIRILTKRSTIWIGYEEIWRMLNRSVTLSFYFRRQLANVHRDRNSRCRPSKGRLCLKIMIPYARNCMPTAPCLNPKAGVEQILLESIVCPLLCRPSMARLRLVAQETLYQRCWKTKPW